MTREKPEAELQRKVLSIAKLYGWAWFHPPPADPRKVGAYVPGWLDLVLCKPPRLLFVELKNEGNYPSPEQREWMARLYACGQEVGVWWPKDLPTVTKVLGPTAERLVLPVRYRPESAGNNVLTPPTAGHKLFT